MLSALGLVMRVGDMGLKNVYNMIISFLMYYYVYISLLNIYLISCASIFVSIFGPC